MGMPLGNWTSQFFANVYLNELDQYVKHTLKAKYYIRYVDDFVILHRSKKVLYEQKQKIDDFLKTRLKIELHPNKSKIVPIGRGVGMLGFRVFYHYKIIRKSNMRKIQARLNNLLYAYQSKKADAYDILEILQGWNGYAMQGNTYKLRKQLLQEVAQKIEKMHYLETQQP